MRKNIWNPLDHVPKRRSVTGRDPQRSAASTAIARFLSNGCSSAERFAGRSFGASMMAPARFDIAGSSRRSLRAQQRFAGV
jgi:hypothetical protein